jgi:hypothetical protein
MVAARPQTILANGQQFSRYIQSLATDSMAVALMCSQQTCAGPEGKATKTTCLQVQTIHDAVNNLGFAGSIVWQMMPW